MVPSLRIHFIRLIVKYLMAPMFRRRSIPEWRDTLEKSTKYHQIPADTEIWPVLVNGIAAEWVRATDAQTDRVVLYLHGGAFVTGSPATHRELAARLSAALRASLLVLDYRLAPECPFPAAMQDATCAYHWLVDEGFTEKRIVVGGDSSGGGLALQTLLALRDEGSPLPAAAFFMSPPTDWVRFDGESYSSRADVDPLNTVATCKFTASHYVANNDLNTPLLFPIGMDLSGLPPLCIHVGDDEILLSDSIRLAEGSRAAGVDVELKIWPGMWHVFQLNARFVPEARQSIEEIRRFVLACCGFHWH